MIPENIVSRVLTQASYLYAALIFCSVCVLAAPSPEHTPNAEILSPELQPILVELEDMIWQDELSAGERRRLVELVPETIYRSEGLSRKAIQAVAAHDVEEAVPSLRGAVLPDDGSARVGFSGWNLELRRVTALAVEGDQPVVDRLWQELQSRPEQRRHEREAVIETLAILEIKRIRADEADGSILRDLPLSERDALLVELAPLAAEEAVEDLVTLFLSSSRPVTSAALRERQTYLLALETYGEDYFSRLPELLAPAHRAEMGSDKTISLLARVRDNLARLEERTALRLKAVLETAQAEGSEKATVVDEKRSVVDSMRTDLVSKIERQLQQRADRQ